MNPHIPLPVQEVLGRGISLFHLPIILKANRAGAMGAHVACVYESVKGSKDTAQQGEHSLGPRGMCPVLDVNA